MWKSFFLIGVLLLAAVLCKPIDSDEEYALGEPIDGSSLEAYRYYISEAEAEPNTSSEERSDTVKREVSADGKNETAELPVTKPTLLLSSFIGRVEGALVHSALSVVSLARVVHNDSDSNSGAKDATTVVPHTVNKRSADNVNGVHSQSIFKYISAKSVPATDNQPAHLAIDRVAVFKANEGLTPLISSLDFHVPVAPTIGETSAKINDRKDKDIATTLTTSSTASTVLKTAAESLNTAPIKELSSTQDAKGTSPASVKESSSSAATVTTASIKDSSSVATTTKSSIESATSPTVTPTTIKTPIEKLKEAEDDVKEKVAEIEAEPIILSARV